MSDTKRSKVNKIIQDLSGLNTEECVEVLETIVKIMKEKSINADLAKQYSLLELEGLGRELWSKVDIDKYLNQQRDSWN